MSRRKECPRCGMPYNDGPRRMSRDHILPQSRGAPQGDTIHGDVRNIEVMCQSCNFLRAACGHCWGAVACMLAITHDLTRIAAVMQRWQAIRQGPALTPRQKVIAHAARYGMRMRYLPAEDFVYPADTAAKRVWNLAVLASMREKQA